MIREANGPEKAVLARLSRKPPDVVVPHVDEEQELRDFLRRILEVGVEGDDDLPRTRSKAAMIAMCWP